ncbi:hypothetical protein BJX61DRAFT_366833 [Aspergillus egyptiacus]|nr:hypothetical protein BJX61DRAFT_366833 [Aspergillus egyptiacus]
MKMTIKYLMLSLLASTSFSASPPRLTTHPAVDITPKRPSAGNRVPDGRSNATMAIAARDLDDLSLFARQSTCGPGAYECPAGHCCGDDQNCATDYCCEQPFFQCGSEGCYDPETEVCCEARSKHCEAGYECTISGGCCREGTHECGEDHCFDPEESVCCPEDGTTCDIGYTCVADGCCRDGRVECGETLCYDEQSEVCCVVDGEDWVCPQGERCCAASGGCYNPDTELCCEAGACGNEGSCCGQECCDAGEMCGENGICVAAPTAPNEEEEPPVSGGVDPPDVPDAGTKEILGLWQFALPVVGLAWRWI